MPLIKCQIFILMYCTGLPRWENTFNLDKADQMKVLGKNLIHFRTLNPCSQLTPTFFFKPFCLYFMTILKYNFRVSQS